MQRISSDNLVAKWCRRIAMVLALATSATGNAAPPDRPAVIAKGVVESIAPTNPASVIIGGLRYVFALDAKVELGGSSFGAPTMVQRGMHVEYTYFVDDATHRTIVLLRELSPDRPVPQS